MNELTTTRTAINAGTMALVDASTDDGRIIALWLGTGKRAQSASTQDVYLRTVRGLLDFVAVPLQAISLFPAFGQSGVFGKSQHPITHGCPDVLSNLGVGCGGVFEDVV